MARLFISPREIHFINDITKEYLKDASGQKIYYFAISVTKTKIHPVYDDSVNKIFENPIEIPAQVGQPEWSTTTGLFGSEESSSIEVFLQARDLLDKGITVSKGDYFTYGDAVFEIIKCVPANNIFGQEEYGVSFTITGKLARIGEFDPKIFFPPQRDGRKYSNAEIQKEFVQQRGLKENQEGVTGDVRQMRERLGDDMAEVALGEGPRTIDTADQTPENADRDKASSFNNESNPVSFYDD